MTLSETKTYNYIKKFIKAHNHAPTTAEIADGIGIASRGVVHRYLRALEDKGYLKLTPNRHRNIVLQTKAEPKLPGIPLVGQIAAGSPIEAIAQHDAIDVVNIFLGENRYALRVKGDSMIDDGIQNGDIIICERSEVAKDGQIVVAFINKCEATLKRFFHNGSKVTLLPANPKHRPQIYASEQVEIQGVYVGLLRIA